MNYKRKKTRKNVRCTLCTTYRWMGNSKGRRPNKEIALLNSMKEDIKIAS